MRRERRERGMVFCYVLIFQEPTAFLTSGLQAGGANITHICLADGVMKMMWERVFNTPLAPICRYFSSVQLYRILDLPVVFEKSTAENCCFGKRITCSRG